MKKAVFIILLLLTFSCSDSNDDPNNILPNIPVNETIFLDLPQYIDLNHPGNYAYSGGGISGIIIYRTLGSGYLAFERAAPHLRPQDCSQMKVNMPFMVCGCDDSKFSILDGSPQTDGVNYPARQYRVTVNGNTLQINNY
ncbi:MAG: hypothetical protein OEM04_12550 [Flavobacteriaceae bacterium]|nr:hypothetical protein [Flavobacteriaceae bacterium]